MKKTCRILLFTVVFSTLVFAETADFEVAAKLFIEKNYAEAYPILEKLDTANSTESKVYLYKGLIERSRKELIKAGKTFSKGLEKNPKNIYLLLELAVTFSWNNQLENSVATYDKVLAIDGKNSPALSGKARVLSWLKRYEQAADIYLGLLKSNNVKMQNEALNGLAFINRMNLKVKKAKDLYRKVLQNDTENREASEGLSATEKDTRNELTINYGTTANSLKNRASDLSFNFSRQMTRKTGILLGMHYHAAEQFLESIIYHQNINSGKPTKTFIFGAKHEFTNRLKMAATLVIRKAVQKTSRYWSLDGSYKLSEKLNLSLGQTTLLTTRKFLEILGFGGLSWKVNGKNNLSFQYFNAGKLISKRTNAIAFNWSNKTTKKFSFNLGIGTGKSPTAKFSTAHGEINWAINRNLDLSGTYTIFKEKIRQRGLIISLKYRF
jgi:tetratricopeptide (TPR) repeat protein